MPPQSRSPAGEREREEEQRKASSGSAARVSLRNKPLELDVEFSREIFDLVASCSLASRFGHREVVWFGYTCSNEKFSTKEGFVAFGSQGVCFTKGVDQGAPNDHEGENTTAL